MWWKDWFHLKERRKGHWKEWILNESLYLDLVFTLTCLRLYLDFLTPMLKNRFMASCPSSRFTNTASKQDINWLSNASLFGQIQNKLSCKSKFQQYNVFQKEFWNSQIIQNENEFQWTPTASYSHTNSGRLLPVTHCGATVGTPLRVSSESGLSPRWIRRRYAYQSAPSGRHFSPGQRFRATPQPRSYPQVSLGPEARRS